MSANSYESKLVNQIEQYRDVGNIHALPDIFHYWSNKYLRPRLNEVMSVDSNIDFYAQSFFTSISEIKSSRSILSIGAGDCSLEVDICKKMLEIGVKEFELTCLEVSPHLLARAEESISKARLGKYIKLKETDINKWKPNKIYSGVMANHSLHHFVELESIFEGVYQCLEDRGVFVSNDMIGRNGHMRWPEVLEFVQGIWAMIPDKLKYNRLLNRFEMEYENWDCSNEGFEGIRAQDILPLLVEKFGFKTFLGFGGIVDVFVDRAFGHNLDPDLSIDRGFVDFLQLLDDRLTDAGQIKPTTMFAIMTKHRDEITSSWRHWTPDYCVRDITADVK